VVVAVVHRVDTVDSNRYSSVDHSRHLEVVGTVGTVRVEGRLVGAGFSYSTWRRN
jgi:hypothetical protein